MKKMIVFTCLLSASAIILSGCGAKATVGSTMDKQEKELEIIQEECEGASNSVRSVDFSNGIYTGDLLVEKRHGFGVYEWYDGHRYEGYWENDRRHGKGIFEWNNGDKYEGDFENGEMSGYGVLYNKIMKFRYEGNFANDDFNGYGEYYHDNGWCYKGFFKDGVPHGEGKRYNKKGKVVQKGIWEYGKYKSKTSMIPNHHKL